MNGRRPALRHGAAVVVFIVFVALVEYWLGWAALLAPWREQSPSAVAAAVLLALLTHGLRAWRLRDYFRAELAGRFAACLRVTLLHNLLNNLLPMRSGELSFPLLMRRHFGMGPVRSTAALLWFRILDLHSLGLFALLALGLHAWGAAATLPLAALWLPLPLLLQAGGGRLRRRFAANDGDSRPVQLIRALLDGLPRDMAAFLRAWAWTLVNWLVKLAVFAWVLALFVGAPAAALWLAAIAGDLTSVLPFHGIAGAGTYEAGIVAALAAFGIDARAALAAAVNLHLFLLGGSLAGGALGLLLPGGRGGERVECRPTERNPS